MSFYFRVTLLVSCCLLPSAAPAAPWQDALRRTLKNGGAYAVDGQGNVLFAHREGEHFVPASTMKLITAAHALRLGREYRFNTEFYLGPKGELGVKGFGDPALVSEELARIAAALKRKLRAVPEIVLDTTYFAAELKIDGASASSNPYDAINGALLSNFNTVFFRKHRNGRIESAEPQTPLTPTLRRVASRYGQGRQRVNIGGDRRASAQYVGELLAAFLRAEGVAVEDRYRVEPIPPNFRALYTHRSTKPLEEHLRELLKFSTNFMANQLFLVLGAERFGEPATVEKGRRAAEEFLGSLGWKDFSVVEGAGLSRRNRLTPKQLVDIVEHLRPAWDLLPIEEQLFRAKTGSLRGVSTLAGVMTPVPGRDVRFAILVNDDVPYDYKFKVARELYNGLRRDLAAPTNPRR